MESFIKNQTQTDDVRRGEKPNNDASGRGEKPKNIEPERGELPGTSAQADLVLSDSDTSSLMSVSSCPSNQARDDRGRFYRKRPLKEVNSDSDTGEKDAARTKSVAKKGRGRPPSTGQYVGLHKARKEAEEALRAERRAEEDAKKLISEDRRVLQVALTRMRTLSGTSTNSEKEKDADDCTASELKEKLEAAASRIKGVIKLSKGLKGINQKTLKDAATTITEVAEVYAERTASDEVRMLRAENTRLARRMAEMQAEQEAMRADLASLRLERLRDPPSTGPAQETELSKVLKEMASLNARFSAMEGRILRPPLQSSPPTGSYAAAAKRAAAPTTAAAPATPTAAPRTLPAQTTAAPRPTPTPQAQEQKPSKGKRKKKTTPPAPTTTTRAQPTATTTPAVAASTAAPKAAPTRNTGEWETVGAKKKAAKQRRRAAEKTKKAAKKLRAPRSTAVVLTLQPAALERGATYAELLKTARTAIDPTKLGITAGLRCKTTQTGARLIEIPGATSGEQADRLARDLRQLLPEEDVRVSRPQKTAQLRIAGLDDSVVVEEIVEAVAKAGQCPPDHVRCGVIRHSRAGMGTAVITCPVATAKKLDDGRRILVGWVSAQIKLLDPRPTRCYRCLSGGHVGVKCPSSVDCSGRCFRCGQPGHTAAACDAAPHCILCAAAGKPADHRAGTKSCAAPKKTKTKTPAAGKQTRSSSNSGHSAMQTEVAADAVQGAETTMDTN